MAAKTWPTPSSDSTPSASRAPPRVPERRSPGTRSRTAVIDGVTMCRQPAEPIAPPILVASVQYAITLRAVDPAPHRPRAAGVVRHDAGHRTRVQQRTQAHHRVPGIQLGHPPRLGGLVVDGGHRRLLAPGGRPRSCCDEDQCDVVATETERVVDRGGQLDLARSRRTRRPAHSGVQVLQVRGRRDHALVRATARWRWTRPRRTRRAGGPANPWARSGSGGPRWTCARPWSPARHRRGSTWRAR